MSRCLALLGTLVIGWAASGCAVDPAAPPKTRNASLVLISIDTLRSDRLPLYGYAEGQTPRLDDFARKAVVFDRAYAQVPLTLPSHATLFTGLLPPRHGVRDNTGFALSDESFTIAERLDRAGYATAGFVSSAVLRGRTGIAQGFDHYDEAPVATNQAASGDDLPAFAQRDGAETIAAASAWLEQRDPQTPFFLFVHLFEPHSPYEPPEPYASALADPYDGEIAYADALVGRLFDALQRTDGFDQSWVVVLSDHGEGLGDHGEQEHGVLLYREALQVPLLVRAPNGIDGGRRVLDPVGLVDVTPTLLDRLELPFEDLDGRPLLGDTPTAGRYVYAESWFPRRQYGWLELRSVIRDRWHHQQAQRGELFDVEADPAETDDLSLRREVPYDMLDFLDDVGRGIASEREISAADRAALASLGYVGGSASGTESGIDPRDGIAAAESLWAFARGETEATPQQLDGLVEAIGRGNEYLLRAVADRLIESGRPGAVESLLGPLASAGEPRSRTVLADAKVQLGRLAEATRLYQQALAEEPQLAQAHLGLGVVALSEGRNGDAEQALRRAVESAPALAEAWNALGVVAMRRRDPRAALESWSRAVEAEPALVDAWFNLGLTAGRLGQRDEAIRALQQYVTLVDGEERRRGEAMLAELGATPRPNR